ncbi:MAG: MFS transporter [Bacilli bacterium]
METITKPIVKTVPSSQIIFTLALGFIMATLDMTIVNVAGPSIRNTMQFNVTDLTWIIDGYVLTFASFLLLSGAFAGKYGAKRVYISGLSIFVLASLLCAMATNPFTLIAGRLIQGLGASLFVPSSLSLLAQSFTDQTQKAKVFGLWSAIVSVASGLGPLVGGALVQTFGWPSIFYINVPIGLLGLALTSIVIKETPTLTTIRIPGVAHLTAIIALSAFAYLLIEVPHQGFFTNTTALALITFLFVSIIFVYTQQKTATPLIHRELQRNRPFQKVNIIGFLLNAALFGGIFMFSLALQTYFSQRALTAGATLVPMMVVFVLGNLFFARVVSRVAVTQIFTFALLFCTVGSTILVVLVNYVSLPVIVGVYALVNFGVGISVPAMTSLTMKLAGEHHTHSASALLTVSRQLGALVGIAMMASVLALFGMKAVGIVICFGIMGMAYFGCFVIARTLKRG